MDKQGRNPIHHVVQPKSFASYENTDLLKTLAAVYDINAADKEGVRPLDLANLQDSGVMAEALEDLGASDGD